MTTLKQSNMLFHQCLLIEMWNMWSWFDEKVPSVWWLTAVCGWLWHLSTSCCWPPVSGRPTGLTTLLLISMLSPHTSLGSSAPSIVVQLAYHCWWYCLDCDITCLFVEQDEVSARTYMTCVRKCVCAQSLSTVIGYVVLCVCIHIRIRYYLSASCARHARPICPMQHWTAYSVCV